MIWVFKEVLLIVSQTMFEDQGAIEPTVLEQGLVVIFRQMA
jgi:hypothetical protein